MKNIDATQTSAAATYLSPLAAVFIRGARPAVPLYPMCLPNGRFQP